MARIDINISAEEPIDGELVAGLITTTLTNHGFNDVTNLGSSHQYATDQDALEAMRGLNPSIFSSEIAVGVSDFDPSESSAGIDGDLPGEEQFPEPEADND